MALILNIDTALDNASVCLSREADPLHLLVNENQKDHAAWLHPAINSLLQEQQCRLQDLDAIAVSIGPGSYTGLRIGLSAAKGFCYALSIPLIAVGTLPVMACAVQEESDALICPMIDARRMEVFTALFDSRLNEKMTAKALVLNETSFENELADSAILFCGSGSSKFQPLVRHPHARFSKTTHNATHLGKLSYSFFTKKWLAPLAYTEPLYIKEFYSPAVNKS